MTVSLAVQPLSVRVDSFESHHRMWILNPVADYLFACGGLVWMLFVMHYFLLGGTDKGSLATSLITVSAIGALFLSEGHTAATLFKAYGSNRTFEINSGYTRLAPAFLAVMAIAGMFFPGIAPVLVKLYLLMVPHHFMSQSYGLARLYCLKQNHAPSKHELLALQLVVKATIAFAVLRQLTYSQWSGTSFLGQAIPFWGPLPEPIFHISQALLLVALLAFAIIVIHRGFCTQRVFPLPALCTLMTSVAAFTMGQAATGIYWLYVSAFFHATQYFMILILSQPNDRAVSLANKCSFAQICDSGIARLFGMIFMVSVFIYIGVPRIFEQFGCSYALALASIFTTINFHHFLLDSVLWRLKRPEVRKALLLRCGQQQIRESSAR